MTNGIITSFLPYMRLGSVLFGSVLLEYRIFGIGVRYLLATLQSSTSTYLANSAPKIKHCKFFEMATFCMD